MPAIERTAQGEGRPSYYETLLALSFLHFARERVDAAVIEVGVGGTLDGTNVLQPLVSVITNVGLDHTEMLGTTHEEIAHDKAGIAKAGVPLDLRRARTERAGRDRGALRARSGAPFFAVAEHARIEQRPRPTLRPGVRRRDGTRALRARTPGRRPLPAPQRRDGDRRARTHAAAARRTAAGRRVAEGFAQFVIPGRMECFPARPAVVFDIAHNPDKGAVARRRAARRVSGRRLTFVVAIGDGKDAIAVLERWFALPAAFVFTTFEAAGRRAVRPQRLASIAQSRGHWARTVADPVDALSVARSAAPTRTGSSSSPARRSWSRRCATGGCRTSARRRGGSGSLVRGALTLRGRSLPWGARTYVMGIVNVTPDSFSGDGVPDAAAATERALVPARRGRRPRRHRRGIDAAWARADRRGARSRAADPGRRGRARARAGRDPVDRHVQGDVFRAAFAAGGDMLNSVWGLDDALAAAAAECGVPVVVMHNKRVAAYEARRCRRGRRVPRRRGTTRRRAPASRSSTSSSIPGSASARPPNTTSPCSDRSRASSGWGFRRCSGRRASRRSGG